MTARPESEFPTILDLRDCLSMLIDRGLGGLAVQIVVAPDSTMQALAQAAGDDGGKPALMIEYSSGGQRLSVSFISTERLSGGGGMPSRSRQ